MRGFHIPAYVCARLPKKRPEAISNFPLSNRAGKSMCHFHRLRADTTSSPEWKGEIITAQCLFNKLAILHPSLPRFVPTPPSWLPICPLFTIPNFHHFHRFEAEWEGKSVQAEDAFRQDL